MESVTSGLAEGRARATRVAQALARPASTERAGSGAVALLVGGVALGNGIVMVLAPGQFGGAAYAPIRPFVGVYGPLLIAAGLLLLLTATGDPALRLGRVAALVLLPLWWSFASSGLVSGVVTLGVQVGAALTELVPRPRALRVDALRLMGLIQLLQAGAILAFPAQFSSPLYGGLAPFLWVLAPAFALAGTGLLFGRGAVLSAAAGLGAVAFGAFALTFIGTRTWTGVVNYGLMLYVLVRAAFVAPGALRATALPFVAAAALALADLVPWLALTSGSGTLAPDATLLRPRTIAAVLLLATAGGLAASGRTMWAAPVGAIVALGAALLAAFGLFAPPTASGPTDPQPTLTAIALTALSGLALASASGVRAPLRWIGLGAAALVCAVAALNALSYVVAHEVVFAALGVATMRLHTAVAYLLIGGGVLALVAPELARSSLIGRLAVGVGAILLLMGLQVFVAVSAIQQLPEIASSGGADVEETASAAAAMLVGLLLTTAAAICAIVYVTTRGIVSPIRELVRAMEAFQRGDRSARAPAAARDELGHAARAFNVMAAELETATARLEADALHDAVTGLPNRRLFRDRLARAIAAAQRDGTGCACVVLDLDGFKEINDTLGHAAGDLVLATVADRLRDELRPSDTAARVGGDEFALVIAAVDAMTLAPVLERTREGLRVPIDLGGLAATVGASVGAAVYPDDGATVEALVEVADARMYEEKRRRDRR